MAYLKLTDSGKNLSQQVSSNGDYNGMKRIDIIQKKIDDGKHFTIGDKEGGKKIEGLAYDTKSNMLTYREPGKTEFKEIKITQIFKDPDFGGGKGSGGGADDTKYTESLQCYFCSYVYNVVGSTVTSYSFEDLAKGKQYVKASETLENCLKNGPKIWIETDVYLKTANALIKKWKPNGKTYFHRGSPFMDKIYKAKAACHKLDKKSEESQAPGSFSNDKWNPGDIWASTLQPQTDPLKDYATTWGHLNNRVEQLYKDKQLLGISLKKVERDSAKVEEFNKQGVTKTPVRFVGMKFGSTGDFFSSMDGYIETDKSKVQFRSFSGGTSSWQGEIKGGAAAGGKIGGGNIDFYMKEVFGTGLYPFGDERSTVSYMDSVQFMSEFYDLYAKVNNKTQNYKPLKQPKEFLAELKKMNDTDRAKFMFSKYLVLRMYSALDDATTFNRDKFATRFFTYALSATDQSSFFIKVS